ncbi:glucuronate isomerase [Algoriphagus namhaensis]
MSVLTQPKTFIQEDFLLQNQYAKRLYHGFASTLPIIDYHNHLPPAQINSNKKFANLTEIWLAGDHYKWRAMRAFGIDERYITGGASDEEKFQMWAKTVPYTLRNPLYHWSHLELHRYFGIQDLLSEQNAMGVFEECSDQLQQDQFSALGLLKQMKVETVCTTDDPTDTLLEHSEFAQKGIALGMYPAFRPDKAYAVRQPAEYLKYLGKLGESAGLVVSTYDDLLEALQRRVEYFHERGGRLSDHGLTQIPFPRESHSSADLFQKLLQGKSLSEDEEKYFSLGILIELGKMYHSKGWVQQFHLGALRNTNRRAHQNLGPDTGFDSIGDFEQAQGLSNLLDTLDSSDQLPKTILYNLNPRDNELFATMAGNFNDGTVKGKIQFGSGWWYLDQKDGMEAQLNTLSNMGLLSCFVGMLTDSRSFLSFPRHEYFRRILCNLIGKDVEQGLLPWDEKWLGKIVADICYHNAKNYFDFNSENIKA